MLKWPQRIINKIQGQPKLSITDTESESFADVQIALSKNCRWGGGCVIRFTPEGKVDQIVDVPVPNVTSCTFGGKNLDTLYITTARWDMTEKEITKNPYAGCLFASKPGVKGIADSRFAG